MDDPPARAAGLVLALRPPAAWRRAAFPPCGSAPCPNPRRARHPRQPPRRPAVAACEPPDRRHDSHAWTASDDRRPRSSRCWRAIPTIPDASHRIAQAPTAPADLWARCWANSHLGADYPRCTAKAATAGYGASRCRAARHPRRRSERARRRCCTPCSPVNWPWCQPTTMRDGAMWLTQLGCHDVDAAWLGPVTTLDTGGRSLAGRVRYLGERLLARGHRVHPFDEAHGGTCSTVDSNGDRPYNAANAAGD